MVTRDKRDFFSSILVEVKGTFYIQTSISEIRKHRKTTRLFIPTKTGQRAVTLQSFIWFDFSLVPCDHLHYVLMQLNLTFSSTYLSVVRPMSIKWSFACGSEMLLVYQAKASLNFTATPTQTSLLKKFELLFLFCFFTLLLFYYNSDFLLFTTFIWQP